MGSQNIEALRLSLLLKMSMGVCGLAELMKKGLQVDAHSPIEFCFTFTLTVFCGLSAAEGLRINPAP